MDEANMTRIPDCPKTIPDASGCRKVLGQYNRLVALHRLSELTFDKLPQPVYEFPDNLFWYQQYQFATMCVNRSGGSQ
jgi:hypothetical protein